MALTLTPTTYHNATFDLPKNRYVGILSCQRDPLITTLLTKVISCDKVIKQAIEVGGTEGKKAKGKGKTVVIQPEEEWEIQLEDTVLFPEGGGQPSDTGRLVKESAGDVEIRQVLRRKLDAVHYSNMPIEVGSTVQVVIDSEKRNDYMDQHTGQHLLSAVFDTLDIPTLGWTLSPYPTPSYIEIGTLPTPAQLEFVQDRCNELIRENKSIKVHVSEAGGAITRGEKMPEDYVGGVVRVVEIEGVDSNPCCGTHYPSLGYLQSLFIFPNTTSIRGTNFRLSFIVGSRVINHLTTASAIVRSSASILGCAAGEVSDRSKIVMNNARDGLKKEKALLEELARLVAKDLVSGAFASGTNKVVSYYREEDSTNGLEFLSMLSAELNIHVANAGNPTCLFNLMATSSPNHPSPTSSLVIFGTESLVQQAAKKLTEIFGDRLKGGGKARWQGKMKDSRIFLDEANRIEEALLSLTLL